MAPTETAHAKINLTLRVRGRRADGYHELESLVAFADFGDTLSLEPGGETSLETDGPFAAALDAGNLVLRAARMWEEEVTGVCCGAFHLTKRIPVAAGLGGGSADAGAALRLLARAFPAHADDGAAARIAGELGADVPVCLASRPALMRGAGERLSFLSHFPAVAMLMVNPGVAVATGEGFALLDAPALDAGGEAEGAPDLPAIGDLVEFMRARGNDLEAPAMRIAPAIGEAKAAIARTPGCLVAAMSGSGATCFGLYRDAREAQTAGRQISRSHPEWWVRAAALRPA